MMVVLELQLHNVSRLRLAGMVAWGLAWLGLTVVVGSTVGGGFGIALGLGVLVVGGAGFAMNRPAPTVEEPSPHLEASAALGETVSEEELCGAAWQAVQRFRGFPSGARVRFLVSRGYDRRQKVVFVAGEVGSATKGRLVHQDETSIRSEGVFDDSFAWSLVVPIRVDRAVVGSLSLESDRPAPQLRQDMRTLAASVGQGLRRIGLESELRNREARLRSLVENGTDMILVVDAEGHITWASPSVGRVLGYTRAVGYRLSDLTDDADLLIDTTLQGTQAIQSLWRTADGDKRIVESVRRNLQDVAAVGGIVFNARDITERVQVGAQLEQVQQEYQQAQKLEALGRLAGGVAHDFNNLLTVIQSYTMLMRDGLHPDDPRSDDLDQVEQAAARAGQLTRQLLSFSRRSVLHAQTLDLNDLVRRLERMVRRVIGEDIELHLSLAHDLPPVHVDPGGMEQVLLNLMVNARDAMPAGGRIGVTTELEGGQVQLLVTDTGGGIDEDSLANVFEPFFTTKPVGKGTGLGLAMAYGFVTQSGGSMEVESAPGEGATFVIRLPASEAAAEPLAGESTEAPTGTEMVLLVEDEGPVRQLARRILTARGYRVLSARNAEEAERFFRTHCDNVALVLTDVVMPRTSGPELVRRLREKRPDLNVLFMSGYPRDAFEVYGLDPASRNLLEKPFTPSTLARDVRRALDSRAS